ncbi:MAG: hypothetical protein WAM39_20380 [Bryobacteraceae bacterium]
MTEPTTDKEWADYFAAALRGLDKLAERTPEGSQLRKRVDEAAESVGLLVGYLIG